MPACRQAVAKLLLSDIMLDMAEREKFEPQKPSVKPGVIDAWDARKAVVDTLFEVGKPTSLVKDSVCGPDVPNKYNVNGNVVESFPTWSYMYKTVFEKNDKGETNEVRTFHPLDLSKKPEEVIAEVKKNIL